MRTHPRYFLGKGYGLLCGKRDERGREDGKEEGEWGEERAEKAREEAFSKLGYSIDISSMQRPAVGDDDHSAALPTHTRRYSSLVCAENGTDLVSTAKTWDWEVRSQQIFGRRLPQWSFSSIALIVRTLACLAVGQEQRRRTRKRGEKHKKELPIINGGIPFAFQRNDDWERPTVSDGGP